MKRVRLLLGIAPLAFLTPGAACADREGSATAEGTEPIAAEGAGGEIAPTSPEALYAEARSNLVSHLRAQGIDDEAVLGAIGRVKRHEMVPEPLRAESYADRPLPIGHDQTISQPFVVALMSQLADVDAGEKVLEIGTGSGYQAAVLAELGARVYSIEIVEPLARRTRERLDAMGYEGIHTRIGDGYRGWPDEAPFDAIVVTAAPPEIPEPLKAQLAVGGRMVVPVGERFQDLVVLTRTEDGFERERSIPVRFVPMTGEARERGGP